MKREEIPVCKTHNRFQTENHRWLNTSEDLDNHIVYTHSQDALLVDSPCDKCEIDVRPHCSVHTRTQMSNGEWLTGNTTNALESPCDLCND